MRKETFPTGEMTQGILNRLNQAYTDFLRESNAIEGVYDEDSLEQAQYAWLYLCQQEALSIDVVLKTHKILMLHSNLQPDQKGYFRKIGVRVGTHYPPSAWQVPSLMWHWCLEAMRASPEVDPIKLHIDFEMVHGFVDGNGRLGRMLMNWLSMKRLAEPYILIIEEKDRKEYYRWFREPYESKN